MRLTSLRRNGVGLVVTDVAAIPCAAAAAAGIPAVILSNFTWDWIYAEFLDAYPELAAIINWQCDCYRQAGLALRLPFHGPMPVAQGGRSTNGRPAQHSPRRGREEPPGAGG